MLPDDIHQRYIVEQQFVIINVELHGRKLERLLNKINVAAFHYLLCRGCNEWIVSKKGTKRPEIWPEYISYANIEAAEIIPFVTYLSVDSVGSSFKYPAW